MPERTASVLTVIVLLTGAAGAALWFEKGRTDNGHTVEFQRLVGGLGFGPAFDLDGCAAGLDPRLDAPCALLRGPVPGGRCFCPRHAGTPMRWTRFAEADRASAP